MDVVLESPRLVVMGERSRSGQVFVAAMTAVGLSHTTEQLGFQAEWVRSGGCMFTWGIIHDFNKLQNWDEHFNWISNWYLIPVGKQLFAPGLFASGFTDSK